MRTILGIAAALLALAAFPPAPARAQGEQPLSILVGFAPGGSAGRPSPRC